MTETIPHYFVCGIGGSGMLPLAVILLGMGYRVSGSDRSYDQGRTPEKFRWLAAQGIILHPQDGSGIGPEISTVVISKAVEDTVPDIAAAKAQSIPILKRSDLLIDLFNRAGTRIAVSGTSGKTTTTGMIAFLLKESGLDPTVMNGGIFRNYAKNNPYSTAFVGKGNIFVSEIDESDGIDAVVRYAPDIAVIHNISLDHQPMEELTRMFSGFLAKTKTAILNADDPAIIEMAAGFSGEVISYGTGHAADVQATDILPRQNRIEARITAAGQTAMLRLSVPGVHNISNALAALAAGQAMNIPLVQSVEILSRFTGIRRRMEIVGVKNGITVMDDFAHNPDKIAATLATLKQFPGRLHIFFQPHGYGFLKIVGAELGAAFADHMDQSDKLYLVEPFYAGGTVDRSVGAQQVVDDVVERGHSACLMPGRAEIKETMLNGVRPGDRIIIMGARDDTLSDFALEIVNSII